MNIFEKYNFLSIKFNTSNKLVIYLEINNIVNNPT